MAVKIGDLFWRLFQLSTAVRMFKCDLSQYLVGSNNKKSQKNYRVIRINTTINQKKERSSV